MRSTDDPMSVAFAEAREAERRGETPIGAAPATRRAAIPIRPPTPK
jgi:hypothetical protein